MSITLRCPMCGRPLDSPVPFRVAVRAKRGPMTFAQASHKETGVSAASICRIENGKRPGVESLYVLCKWTGCSPESVLRELSLEAKA